MNSFTWLALVTSINQILFYYVIIPRNKKTIVSEHVESMENISQQVSTVEQSTDDDEQKLRINLESKFNTQLNINNAQQEQLEKSVQDIEKLKTNHKNTLSMMNEQLEKSLQDTENNHKNKLSMMKEQFEESIQKLKTEHQINMNKLTHKLKISDKTIKQLTQNHSQNKINQLYNEINKLLELNDNLKNELTKKNNIILNLQSELEQIESRYKTQNTRLNWFVPGYHNQQITFRQNITNMKNKLKDEKNKHKNILKAQESKVWKDNLMLEKYKDQLKQLTEDIQRLDEDQKKKLLKQKISPIMRHVLIKKKKK